MTTVTFHRIGQLEVQTDGKLVTIPTHALGFDSDLRDVAAQAMANPGVAVPVPSTARMPRPRYSQVYGVKL